MRVKTVLAKHLLDAEALAAAARQARLDAGLTQEHAARLLGVTQAAVSRAEAGDGLRYAELRCRMLEQFGGFSCEGPVWHVRRIGRPPKHLSVQE